MSLQRNAWDSVPHGTIKAAHGIEVVGGSFLGNRFANRRGKPKVNK